MDIRSDVKSLFLIVSNQNPLTEDATGTYCKQF